MDETPVKIGGNWYPRGMVGCPSCGSTYGHHNTSVCTFCEECSKCCSCKKDKRKIVSVKKFLETL